MQRYLLTVAGVLLARSGASLPHGAGLANGRTVDLIRSYNYDADEYHVRTADGYLLALTHIRSAATKPPVLMVHGVIASSDQWVLRGPGQDLALLLVDQGHDVWLSDNRGNFYSRNHEYLKPSDPEFWNYSFHEMGLYDLPALIDSVLLQSNHSQLYYVGHSMGTTCYYVMGSLRPEYNEKVKMAVHLAPIAFGLEKKMTALLQLLLQNVDAIANQLKKQNVYEFLPRSAQNQGMIDLSCTDNRICELLISQVYGKSNAIIPASKLKTYLKRLVSGTSVKSMVHLSQIYKGKKFALYDYGSANRQIYSEDQPPQYPLELITSPVALLYGENDAFIDDYSITELLEHLPNVVASIAVPKYNHIDPLFAETSSKLIYKKIIKLLNKS